MKGHAAFPERVTIELGRRERCGLQHVADYLRIDNPLRVLRLVIARGLVGLVEPETQERENPSERTPLAGANLVSQMIDPNPVPFGMKCTPQQQHAKDAEFDRESARMTRELGLSHDDKVDSPRPTPHPHVEPYLAAAVPEKVRQRFEDFLDDHPEMGEDEAIVTLLQRALDHETRYIQGAAQSPKEKRATQMVRLAEKLYLRSKRRCQE